MPANDSMSHRGVSAVRKGRRFTPYHAAENNALKPHASCPTICLSQDPPILCVSSPEDSTLDCGTEISSTATLVNPSFETDKWECAPTPLLAECTLKSLDKPSKPTRSSFHQKKVDYISCLIDFTCLTMNEIWNTADIPAVFRYQHGATFGYTSATASANVDKFTPRECLTDLISLRKFVSELLRRSRSTCSTLQTALCYIEAIRTRVQEHQQAEKEGRGSRGDAVANEGKIQSEDSFRTDTEADLPTGLKALPKLPSPLLCPRRVFMAALVLSAKFVQDKCYSNRAWAKLCGLPPREVSRCERAVGDALDWRLWVGKGSAFPFAGLESKIGRAPTMISTYPAVVEDLPAPLSRSQTWPSTDVLEVPSTCSSFVETEFSKSPTPSLSSSGSSICSSGALSPFYSSPSPMFVPNDPCLANNKLEATQTLRLSSYLNEVAAGFTHCGDLPYFQQEQDVFGMRVVDGIQVV